MSRARDAELILDTDRAAAGIGFRSAGTTPRQLVYRLGGTTVDVMAPTAGDPGAFVWGSVTGEGDAPKVGAAVTWVRADGARFSRGETDQFGEFRLRSPADCGGSLVVELDDGAVRCPMPAPRPVAGDDSA